jgi:hypothetical protein
MTTTIQQAIENTHVHYVFIMTYARTRDFAEAKDAAGSAARTLTELARLLSSTSPLFSEMHQLRSIIHAAQQNLARQQQPQNLDKGLELITMIEEHIAP